MSVSINLRKAVSMKSYIKPTCKVMVVDFCEQVLAASPEAKSFTVTNEYKEGLIRLSKQQDAASTDWLDDEEE